MFLYCHSMKECEGAKKVQIKTSFNRSNSQGICHISVRHVMAFYAPIDAHRYVF